VLTSESVSLRRGPGSLQQAQCGRPFISHAVEVDRLKVYCRDEACTARTRKGAKSPEPPRNQVPLSTLHRFAGTQHRPLHSVATPSRAGNHVQYLECTPEACISRSGHALFSFPFFGHLTDSAVRCSAESNHKGLTGVASKGRFVRWTSRPK
jgi:hypothetical protein